MLKVFLLIGLFLSAVLLFPPHSYSESSYTLSYDHFMTLAMDSLEKGNYREAIGFFKKAQLVNPAAQKPLYFINLIKRIQEGRVDEIGVAKEDQGIDQKRPIPPKRAPSKDALIEEALDRYQQPLPSDMPMKKAKIVEEALDSMGVVAGKSATRIVKSRAQSINEALDDMELIRRKRVTISQQEPSKTLSASQKKVLTKSAEEPLSEARTVELNDELFSSQPKTNIKIEYNKSIILEGSNIERFLTIAPEYINVKRIDRDHLLVEAKKRGTTIFHLWDDKGRWTFNVEVILAQRRPSFLKGALSEEYNDPFRFTYMSDWSTFYSDENAPSLERRTLSFIQRMLLEGESPYGRIDANATLEKLDTESEFTGYSVGLSDGRIWRFKDFNVRGFDVRKTFSPLSMPGKYLRGALLEGTLLEDNVAYSFVWGRDRSTFGFLTPGAVERRDSFIEGGRLELFPRGKHQYAFNYARGYGTDREDYLKDKVMSFQMKQRLESVTLSSEIAYDEENYAGTIGSEFKLGDRMKLGLNFRDIEGDYVNITGIPSNRGEIGGTVFFNWYPQAFNLRTNLDVYRDRFLGNAERPGMYNFDLNSSIDVPLSSTSNWGTSVYFVDTPGLLSPYRSLRVYNQYTKRFKLPNDRVGSATLGNTYQRSRYSFSPVSEYDRYGVNAGIRIPLKTNLSYFLNYDYFWVEELLTGIQSNPRVMNTGFGYSRKLSETLYSTANVSYRKEEDTQGSFSFLAGEDSVTGSLGLSYRPNQDLEFFADSRVRNVWPEDPTRDDYMEAELRLGLRSSWELPFTWNPTGDIRGMVFKDINGDGKRDPDEEGIEGVKITVGQKEAVTNEKGEYRVKVTGKKVDVGVEFETIPTGFVFSTPLSRKVQIIPHKVQRVDFGLTTSSGIYGVVFYDKNQNNRLDPDDELIRDVKITLDGTQQTMTDFEGTYFFKNISPGKHTILIDVNSIPIEYLPLVKMRNEVVVEEGTTYVFHVPLKKK